MSSAQTATVSQKGVDVKIQIVTNNVYMRRHFYGVVVSQDLYCQTRPTLGTVIKFTFSGGISTSVHLGFLLACAEIGGFTYYAANALAFFPSFAVHFVLQKYWTFRNTENADHNTQLAWFAFQTVLLFLIDATFLYALVEVGGFWYFGVKLSLLLPMAILSYFISKWIFRH